MCVCVCVCVFYRHLRMLIYFHHFAFDRLSIHSFFCIFLCGKRPTWAVGESVVRHFWYNLRGTLLRLEIFFLFIFWLRKSSSSFVWSSQLLPVRTRWMSIVCALLSWCGWNANVHNWLIWMLAFVQNAHCLSLSLPLLPLAHTCTRTDRGNLIPAVITSIISRPSLLTSFVSRTFINGVDSTWKSFLCLLKCCLRFSAFISWIDRISGHSHCDHFGLPFLPVTATSLAPLHSAVSLPSSFLMQIVCPSLSFLPTHGPIWSYRRCLIDLVGCGFFTR